MNAEPLTHTQPTDKSFLVLFFKKEQKKKALLFEKRSKNFCLFGMSSGGYFSFCRNSAAIGAWLKTAASAVPPNMLPINVGARKCNR
jgi:hypothetical protein